MVNGGVELVWSWTSIDVGLFLARSYIFPLGWVVGERAERTTLPHDNWGIKSRVECFLAIHLLFTWHWVFTVIFSIHIDQIDSLWLNLNFKRWLTHWFRVDGKSPSHRNGFGCPVRNVGRCVNLNDSIVELNRSARLLSLTGFQDTVRDLFGRLADYRGISEWKTRPL